MATKSKTKSSIKVTAEANKGIHEVVDTEGITEIKGKIENVNKAIIDAYKSFKNAKNSVVDENVWKGKSADQYDFKFTVIQDRYKQRIVPVSKYSDYLGTVVEEYDKTENDNIKLGSELDK